MKALVTWWSIALVVCILVSCDVGTWWNVVLMFGVSFALDDEVFIRREMI